MIETGESHACGGLHESPLDERHLYPTRVLGAAILDSSVLEQPMRRKCRRNPVIANYDGQNQHSANNRKATKER
jgi:hypothetical protein